MRQVEGSIQDLYGQAVDAAEDTIDAVRKMPATLDDTICNYIENHLYTTAALALGLGWLIGRSHRPFCMPILMFAAMWERNAEDA
jgi:hypothetical protein